MGGNSHPDHFAGSPQVLHLLRQLIHIPQNFNRLFQEDLPLLGQEHLQLDPVEQLDAQFILQSTNGVGNRRLGNVQLPGSLGHALAAADGGKIAQLNHGHRAFPFSAISPGRMRTEQVLFKCKEFGLKSLHLMMECCALHHQDALQQGLSSFKRVQVSPSDRIVRQLLHKQTAKRFVQ